MGKGDKRIEELVKYCSTSIDNEGTGDGYDCKLIELVSNQLIYQLSLTAGLDLRHLKPIINSGAECCVSFASTFHYNLIKNQDIDFQMKNKGILNFKKRNMFKQFGDINLSDVQNRLSDEGTLTRILNRMDVAIIDYKMSNLHSVRAACNSVGLDSIITSDSFDILKCKAAILPGVGAFSEAVKHIKDNKLDISINKFISTGKPFIGICLGFQLLFDNSEEFGLSKGLGIIPGNVKKFKISKSNSIRYPVPQVAWNKLNKAKIDWKNTLLNSNKENDYMYFVHSYYVIPEDEEIVLTTTKYGKVEYCSAISLDNVSAFQFHPEKSGANGLKIYKELKNKIGNKNE